MMQGIIHPFLFCMDCPTLGVGYEKPFLVLKLETGMRWKSTEIHQRKIARRQDLDTQFQSFIQFP